MYIICRTGYDFLCPQLLEQRRCFQRGLKQAAEGNDTNIIVSYTKRTEKFLIGAVTDPCVGHIGQDIVDMLIIFIYCHDLTPKLLHVSGNMTAELTYSDN